MPIMEDINGFENENTILEVSRLIKEFQERFQEKTSKTEDILTIDELEKLWTELKNSTEVMYSDMVRHLMSAVDERDIIRKKKGNT
jgi:hypothetical protein